MTHNRSARSLSHTRHRNCSRMPIRSHRGDADDDKQKWDSCSTQPTRPPTMPRPIVSSSFSHRKRVCFVSHTALSLWTLGWPLSSFDASEQISETRLKLGRLRGLGNQAKDCRQNAPVGIQPHGTKVSPCHLFPAISSRRAPHGEIVRTARYNRLWESTETYTWRQNRAWPISSASI
jgi:hypothetical protein